MSAACSIPSRWVLGIDPGCPGALALFDPDGRPVEVREGPWRERTLKSGKKRKEIDGPVLHGLLHTLHARAAGARTVVILEEVWGREGDGATQAFSFGRSFQAWLQAAAVEYDLEQWEIRQVIPQTWQKTVPGISGTGDARKASYHAAALARWPEWTRVLQGPRGGAKLDPAAALWIGEWGRRFSP